MRLRLKRIWELFVYFLRSLKEDGISRTAIRTRAFFSARFGRRKGRFLPSQQTLEHQRQNPVEGPKISIVTPLYNSDKVFLPAFITSCLSQTYQNFEICLVDASDRDHAFVQEIVNSFDNPRIHYTKLAENGGISANTNEAVKLATGEYLCFADHDDLLAPSALYEMAKTIVETDADFIYSDEALFTTTPQKPLVGHFKPDFSPDYLRSCNYIAHLACLRKSLFDALGGLQPQADGAQDHDLYLRVMEKTDRIVHIPRVLYYWRVYAASTSGGAGAKPYAQEAGRRAVEQHLSRSSLPGTVEDGPFPGTYRVRYQWREKPLVSILIPTQDHEEELRVAVESIYAKTIYPNFEIILVENASQRRETFQYYEKLQGEHENLRVVTYEKPFNYADINNFGRTFAQGQYILLLNNDVEILTEDWLDDMMGYAQRPDVGAVGAKLLYPDGTVQHAGVIVGLGGFAGHSHKYFEDGKSGYMFRLAVAQNLSAVTGACLLVRAAVYDQLGGLDTDFAVAFNDVDFCLRVRNNGYRIVYTPFAKLTHYESKSRGADTKGERRQRFLGEKEKLKARYGKALLEDPYYSPNLTLDMENFAENAVLPAY